MNNTMGNADRTSLVLLGNFEVENQWAQGEPRLGGSVARTAALVNRMDEFALLLGGEQDHVVLKSYPDLDYLEFLQGLGFGLPAIHTVSEQHPDRTVTEDALTDAGLLAGLSRIPAPVALAPHGISVLEEELAKRTGMTLTGPSAAVCKAVNSKVYSRRLAERIGLRQPTGWACETQEELDAALPEAEKLLEAGEVLLIKEAFGVSGKGIATVESQQRLRRVTQLLRRSAERLGTNRVNVVVERLVVKTSDLNYQFTVGSDGSVCFDFVKEAHTVRGVHHGHRFPVPLTGAQRASLEVAAARIGHELAADGYYGVVGVDAMLEPGGGVLPIVEINARNNMSTYQRRIEAEFMKPGQLALAKHYVLQLTAPIGFAAVSECLGELLLARPGQSGLVVNNFATVNAASGAAGGFHGRLYGVLLGADDCEVERMDAEVARRLGRLGSEGGKTA